MNRLARFALIATFLVAGSSATAGTKVLDTEIGITTSEQLRQVLTRNTKVTDRGTNRYSGGKMLATDGTAYEIEGLVEVVYVFDGKDKLAGVVMQMDKERFPAIYNFLRKKYEIVSEQRPFVGDQFARFKPADVFIDLEAPHLSFTMSVRYIRNDLMQKFNVDSAAESASKKQLEAEKF